MSGVRSFASPSEKADYVVSQSRRLVTIARGKAMPIYGIEASAYGPYLMRLAEAHWTQFTHAPAAKQAEMVAASAERQYNRERLNTHLERSKRWKFPETAPNLDHWAKVVGWSTSEAAMLLLGRNPALPVRYPFPEWYAPIITLIDQALAVGRLVFPVAPIECLMWAEEMDIQFPDQLATAVAGSLGRSSLTGAVLPAAIDNQDISAIAVRPPGRPNKVAAPITIEFHRRLAGNLCADKLSVEARYLRSWFMSAHADYPPPAVGSIENSIRIDYWKWRHRPD